MEEAVNFLYRQYNECLKRVFTPELSKSTYTSYFDKCHEERKAIETYYLKEYNNIYLFNNDHVHDKLYWMSAMADHIGFSDWKEEEIRK